MPRPTVRTITDDELQTFSNTTATAMVSPPISDEGLAFIRKVTDLTRCHAAIDNAGTICGAAKTYGMQLTVPGGDAVPAAGVTAVGVLPTHRRQGHLSRMMKAQLRDVADRGEQVAVLIAAEYPIYGRFGYGPAIDAIGWEVDASAQFRDEPSGSVALSAAEEVRAIAHDIYERVQPTRSGFQSIDDERLGQITGIDPEPWGDGKAPRRTWAVWRDRRGDAQGFAAYHVDGDWQRNRPKGKLLVDLLLAATPEAERELWRFVTSVDWITTVRAGLRPPDDLLPLFLTDGRFASALDRSDNVWARVLDARAALAARRYGADGRLVLEVVDPGGPTKGRVVLEGGPDGATCARSKESPDLTIGASALGAAYLGGTSVERLASAGWIQEATQGAVGRAAAMFTAHPGPWSPFGF